MTEPEFKQVLEQVENNTSSTLKLNIKTINKEQAAVLIDSLISKNNFQVLDLSDNAIEDEIAIVLAKVLVHNSTIESLDLRNNCIGPAGAIALASALIENDGLLILTLFDNKIGDKGAIAFASALIENYRLQELSLSHNQIGDIGAIVLAYALIKNYGLLKLNLFYNKIGDKGAIAFASALIENYRLQELSLSHNQIGNAGFAVFAKTLSYNSVLENLQLDHNQIGNGDIADFDTTLPHNSALQNLDLRHNKIKDKDIAVIAKILPHYSALQTLYLLYNKIKDKGAKVLVDILMPNLNLDIQFHIGNGDMCDSTINEIINFNKMCDATKVLYSRNVHNQRRLQINWCRVALLTAFRRANPGRYMDSILNFIIPIQNTVFDRYYHFNPPMTNCSNFIDTRFHQWHLKNSMQITQENVASNSKVAETNAAGAASRTALLHELSAYFNDVYVTASAAAPAASALDTAQSTHTSTVSSSDIKVSAEEINTQRLFEKLLALQAQTELRATIQVAETAASSPVSAVPTIQLSIPSGSLARIELDEETALNVEREQKEGGTTARGRPEL